jgi:hypothetical protein
LEGGNEVVETAGFDPCRDELAVEGKDGQKGEKVITSCKFCRCERKMVSREAVVGMLMPVPGCIAKK